MKVKVRIAVAVDKQGIWNSCGWSTGEAGEMRELACDTVSNRATVYWLTAELDAPNEQTVTAVVEAEKGDTI